jgi:hypothetical protein
VWFRALTRQYPAHEDARNGVDAIDIFVGRVALSYVPSSIRLLDERHAIEAQYRELKEEFLV